MVMLSRRGRRCMVLCLPVLMFVVVHRCMVSCLLAMLMTFVADRRCMVSCLIVLMLVAAVVVVEQLALDRSPLFCFCHLMWSLIVVVAVDQMR